MPCRISTKRRRIREREVIIATGREGRASLNESGLPLLLPISHRNIPGSSSQRPLWRFRGPFLGGYAEPPSLNPSSLVERTPILTVGFIQIPQNRNGVTRSQEKMFSLLRLTPSKKSSFPWGMLGKARCFSTSKFLFWYGSKSSSTA